MHRHYHSTLASFFARKQGANCSIPLASDLDTGTLLVRSFVCCRRLRGALPSLHLPHAECRRAGPSSLLSRGVRWKCPPSRRSSQPRRIHNVLHTASSEGMARGNSRMARAGPSSPASSSSPAIGGRQKLITGRIQGVDKDVSRIIYGTLFLHTFENDEACFDLLDSVWAAGCNAFDCAAI